MPSGRSWPWVSARDGQPEFRLADGASRAACPIEPPRQPDRGRRYARAGAAPRPAATRGDSRRVRRRHGSGRPAAEPPGDSRFDRSPARVGRRLAARPLGHRAGGRRGAALPDARRHASRPTGKVVRAEREGARVHGHGHRGVAESGDRGASVDGRRCATRRLGSRAVVSPRLRGSGSRREAARPDVPRGRCGVRRARVLSRAADDRRCSSGTGISATSRRSVVRRSRV